MGVTRLDKIRNNIIRQTLGLNHTIIEQIDQKRMRFFGHIQRMANHRYPKLLLGANIHGTRPKGRPPKRWTDGLKANCKARNFETIAEAGRMAQDRKAWSNIMTQMARQSDTPVPMP